MSRKIYGNTVFTPIEPQAVIDKTKESKLIENNVRHTEDKNIHVTLEEKEAWNKKSNFSGSYNDLTDKPMLQEGSDFWKRTSLYNVTQDSNDDVTAMFDISAIETDKTLNQWDLLLTPSGRVYQITSITEVFVDAQYLSTIPVSCGLGVPEVTEADNGKVLAVVNGAWGLANVECDLTEIATLIGGIE